MLFAERASSRLTFWHLSPTDLAVQDGKGPLQPHGAAPFFVRSNLAFAVPLWLPIGGLAKVNSHLRTGGLRQRKRNHFRSCAFTNHGYRYADPSQAAPTATRERGFA
jgi:hypothetical protein